MSAARHVRRAAGEVAGLKVTLDTNTFPLEQALAALRGKDADVAVTTVTTRELRGSDWENEV